MTFTGVAKDDKAPNTDHDLMRPDSLQADPAQEPISNGPEKIFPTIEANATPDISSSSPLVNETKDEEMPDADFSEKMESAKQRFMEFTKEYGVPQLEILYTKVIRGLISATGKDAKQDNRQFIVRYLFRFIEEADKF